jgi:hypothetical protein
MLKRKKKIIISSIILSAVLILTGVFMFYLYNPYKIFKRKFGFNLPKSAEIIEHNYSILGERTYVSKISFDEIDFDYIEKNFLEYYCYNKPFEINPEHHYAGFKVYASWWDCNMDNVIFAHTKFDEGVFVKTIEIYTFITIDEDGEYLLYVIN